ncbi:MAG: hypothetical protein CMM87_02775 [Rickettsiales bacterium]|nr:hypothetical protein [Rickettsiales bacterium]
MKDLGRSGYRKIQQCGVAVLLAGCLAFNVQANFPIDADDDIKRGIQLQVLKTDTDKENRHESINQNQGMTKIVYEIPDQAFQRPLTPLGSLRRMVRGS